MTIVKAGTHTTHQKTDVTFTCLYSTLHKSSLLLQMRRVFDAHAQRWRASMISWSYREVTKQCALQTMLRKGSATISHARVVPKCGEVKVTHREALERQRTMTPTVRWPAVGGLVRCPSEPTILYIFSGPNSTAAAPTPFHMHRSRYSL